jgi:hypothetical protein
MYEDYRNIGKRRKINNKNRYEEKKNLFNHVHQILSPVTVVDSWKFARLTNK